jgi:hypothetical protein
MDKKAKRDAESGKAEVDRQKHGVEKTQFLLYIYRDKDSHIGRCIEIK